jgi:alpha-beta hydrolase superfamily lysophospholipase
MLDQPLVSETTCHTPSGAASGAVRRTPFYFESHGTWLFAWLHESDSTLLCQKGVIICPPVGHEQIRSHRALRHLADALARVGFRVMRFDYHGTGDSPGVDEDADRHATWLTNLRSARRWLSSERGCTEISIVGLRVGAALAAQSAAAEPVADLVLWAPVVKGRTYVREMKALSATAGAPAAAGDGIETAGFTMTQQTVQDLGNINLLKTWPRCRRALVVDRDDLQTDAHLLEHLRRGGIATQQTAPPGYAEMMADLPQLPQQAIAEIVAWLRSGCALSDFRAGETRAERAWPIEAIVPHEPGRLLRERAVRLCRQPDLFGILSEAVAPPPAAELPAVVLLNTGCAYRVGPNRLNVLLARRLAARGFRCLRMDLHGLGDSVTPDPAREDDPYAATALRDIDLTLKFMHRAWNSRRVVLIGLCSGAYAAFQSAIQLADPGLVHCIMINQNTFNLQKGMTPGETLALNLSLVAVRRPGKWLKLLTGSSKLGIRGAIRVLLDCWRRRCQSWRPRPFDADAPAPSHPKQNDLPGDLARIAERARRLTFFYARTDPGYDILTFYAKRSVETMCRTGLMRVRFMENADHTFSRRAPREALLQALVAELGDRYLGAPPGF